ncbi:uncharacterized protein [Henckelia pumila]
MNSVEDLVSQSIKKRSNNTSVESESVFGEGKLLIELKIAKDGTGEEGKENTEDRSIEGLVHKEYQIMNKNSDKQSVCHLCNKTFASGKALGGHMRIHSQKGMKKNNLIFKNKLKAHQSVKFKKQNPRAEEDRRETDSVKKKKSTPSADERRACTVCQRVFPSWKSVFGHMRKHSDRKWRGMSPPSTGKTNSGSCLSEEKQKNGDQDELLSISGKDGGVDLTAYSRGWTSTAKRGRKRLSLERDDFQLKELEAAATLLMLLKGLDFVSGFVHRQKGDELEDVKSKLEVGESSSIGGRDLLEEKILIKNKKKRKKLKLSDLQQPQNAASQIEETKENGVGRSRNFHEIDLNKLPPSEFEVEAPLMLGRRKLKPL